MPSLRIALNSQDVTWRPNNNVTTTWAAAWPGNTVTVHWVLVFNETSGDSSLYINGALVSTQANADPYNATPGNFQIGVRATSSTAFNGRQDAIAVYARARTVSEIKSHSTTGAVALTLNTGRIRAPVSPPVRL